MSEFTQPLTVTKVKRPNGKFLWFQKCKWQWVVEREFIYHVGKEDSEDVVKIPKGFITDFASVPRAFWIIFPPDGGYTQAAVVHDNLYWTLKRTRLQSDNILLEAMGVLKVPLWKKRIIYRAVRMFGWLSWNKRKKELK